MISHHLYSNKRETTYFDESFGIPVRPNKKRRIASNVRVRFNDEVIFHESNETANDVKNKQSSSLTSTWLTPNDYTKIRNSVFTTLEFIKLQGDSFGVDTPLSSRYCARGLEDYDTAQKCTKFSTVQRRNEAIQAVLKEQEFQRQLIALQLQEGMPFCSRGVEDFPIGQKGMFSSINNIQQRQFNMQRQQYMQRLRGGTLCSGVLDNSRISEIYIHHTFQNVEHAIDIGRKDSEDALAIYRSKPLPLAVSIAPMTVIE